MPRGKITPAIKEAIYKKHKSSSLLGVRGIAAFVLNKYKISLSKSTVSNILRDKGLKLKKGPKFAKGKYASQLNSQCGLLLLMSLDSEIGLFNRVADELTRVFSGISKKLLRKFIVFSTLSAYAGVKESELKKADDLLKLAGIKNLPVKKYELFLKNLLKYRPGVNIEPIKESIQLISTIRFNFKNGYKGFSDAKLSTFWGQVCTLEHFFLPLEAVQQRLKTLTDNGLLIIGYTKSYDYLSPLIYNFSQGVKSGIKTIDLINPEGKTIRSLTVMRSKITFCFGYYPRILNKGVEVKSKSKKSQKVFRQKGREFYTYNMQSNFHIPKLNKDILAYEFRIKEKTIHPCSWAVVVLDENPNYKVLVNTIYTYLYIWTNVSQEYIDDLKAIEKSVFSPRSKVFEPARIFPKKMIFSKYQDFSRIGFILSVMFKEVVWGWEVKARPGRYFTKKEYLNISILGLPKGVKKYFNRGCYKIGKRGVFLS